MANITWLPPRTSTSFTPTTHHHATTPPTTSIEEADALLPSQTTLPRTNSILIDKQHKQKIPNCYPVTPRH